LNTFGRVANGEFMPTPTEQISEFSGRKFSHGGIVIYLTRVKPTDAAKKGQVLARFVLNCPKTDGIPYIGFPISLPRSNNENEHPEKYGRGTKLKDGTFVYSDSLLIEPRLYSDTFDLKYRELQTEEKRVVFEGLQLPVPKEEVVVIHAKLLDGHTSNVYGLNWPLIPRDGESKTVLENQSRDFAAAREWTLYIPKYDNEIKLLGAMGNAFAMKERGETFEHYKHNGRFG
jgi:hypothetical protein